MSSSQIIVTPIPYGIHLETMRLISAVPGTLPLAIERGNNILIGDYTTDHPTAFAVVDEQQCQRIWEGSSVAGQVMRPLADPELVWCYSNNLSIKHYGSAVVVQGNPAPAPTSQTTVMPSDGTVPSSLLSTATPLC